MGCAVGRPPRGASQRRPGAGVLAVNGAAAFKVGFVPDDEALTLVIGLEPALAVHALVHDKAQTPSSAPPQPGPLPCWWSRVVRGWASCCGHDVLPLSADDPGGVVTRGSRALVTADKGNGPLCVRSFVTWVRDRSSTG